MREKDLKKNWEEKRRSEKVKLRREMGETQESEKVAKKREMGEKQEVGENCGRGGGEGEETRRDKQRIEEMGERGRKLMVHLGDKRGQQGDGKGGEGRGKKLALSRQPRRDGWREGVHEGYRRPVGL